MDKDLDLVPVTIRVIDFMECDSDVKKWFYQISPLSMLAIVCIKSNYLLLRP